MHSLSSNAEKRDAAQCCSFTSHEPYASETRVDPWSRRCTCIVSTIPASNCKQKSCHVSPCCFQEAADKKAQCRLVRATELHGTRAEWLNCGSTKRFTARPASPFQQTRTAASSSKEAECASCLLWPSFLCGTSTLVSDTTIHTIQGLAAARAVLESISFTRVTGREM